MAPTSGIEAAEQIHKYSPNTGIVAVSVHTPPSYVRKLLRVGATGYVTKNSPQQELPDAIESVSKGQRYVCTE
jgi:DNA-binding NarL/FixJ family response regulator